MGRHALLKMVLLVTFLFSCDESVREGFKDYRTLTITGRVYDLTANRGLEGATVRFFALWDSIGSTAKTDALGYYYLEAPKINCNAFAGTPPEYDPLYEPDDHYFISAAKTGYITSTFGAWHAEIHCYDAPQIFNFFLRHSNDPRKIE